jgi:sec-independent protein translocase protein TatC
VLERFRNRGRRPIDDAPQTMTLVEHLTELRNRVIICMVAIAIGGIVGFLVYNRVLHVLQRPYCDINDPCTFVALDPLEGFAIRLKVSAYVGFLIASPVVLWQLWRFITPGLHPKERKYAVPFVVSGVVLFLLGAAIALLTFPEALKFLSAVGGDTIQSLYSPGKYINLIVFMMLAFGAGFEFPVVLVFLQLVNILKWRQLAGWWRYAVVVIFFVDAVITPSQDPISLLALGIPMSLFYGGSILIGRFIQRNRT